MGLISWGPPCFCRLPVILSVLERQRRERGEKGVGETGGDREKERKREGERGGRERRKEGWGRLFNGERERSEKHRNIKKEKERTEIYG